jgi:diguanylate cyclase (GGDEF)-like protein
VLFVGGIIKAMRITRRSFRNGEGELKVRVRVGILLFMTALYAAGIRPAAITFDGDAFDLLVLPVAAYAGLGGTVPALVAIVVGIIANSLVERSVGGDPMAWVDAPHLVALVGVAIGFSLMRRYLLRSRATARTLARSQAALQQVVRNAPVILNAYDVDGRFTLREGRALLGVGQVPGDNIGVSARDHYRRTYPDQPQLVDFLDRALAGNDASGLVMINGRTEDSHFSPIRDAAGAVTGAVAVAIDVTEQRAFEEELRHRALYDSLTDLPNRALLDDRLAQEIAGSRRDGGTFALVLADLDNFKDINDTFGHAKGDDVLREVAHRLGGAVRSRDTVARLGGDEFALVLSGADEAAAAEITERILGSFARPLDVGGNPVDLSASFGIAMFPAQGSDPQTLLRHADIAMYVAKRTRRSYAVYSAERDEPDPEAVTLVAQLREAIGRREIALAFQPEVRTSDRSLLRVEALARWQRPGTGPIPPGRFIPLAERAGLIGALTRQVIDDALRQARSWRDAGLQTVVAVNVSAQDLLDPRLASSIDESLARWGLHASTLAIEITESVLMTDIERTAPRLAALRALGISVGIDDFGTGYSSLAYLSRLPVDRIKIDRSFVRGMSTDPGSRAIARAAAELGHELGLHVVAEGVETAPEWEHVSAIGCDSVQGYYIARPMAPDALVVWARDNRRDAAPPLLSLRALG